MNLLVLALLFRMTVPAPELPAQEAETLRVQNPDGYLDPGVPIVHDRGFAAVPASQLRRLGWSVMEVEDRLVARWQGGKPAVELRPGNPFLSWDGEGVQLTEAPYLSSGRVFLPLQFYIDILPWKLPEVFAYDSRARTLVVGDPGVLLDPVRVVVIDPGHGGRDPGAGGRGGTQEKDVALAIALAMAQSLRDVPDLQVFLTRDVDTLIPIWKRGELATEWKGEHPGVFVSIHANALPRSRDTRGFETYFLSEARTEHERRVAALENAAQEFEAQGDGVSANPDLSFILTELRSLDHQHWSALLAGLVQDQLALVHPGPNRGVKQGPLAVITNALMPAVLVEVGFLTNTDEETLLTQATFQQETATALADAVLDFFRRYPAGGYMPGRDSP